MEQNISEIVKKAKAGDERAISSLYEMFYSKGIGLAQHYVHNRSDAEDMYQDSFIKAMQNLDRFDESKDFAPWFNTIISNTCKNYLDKMRPENFGDISSEDLDYVDTIENKDVDIMPETSFDRKEMTSIMDEIMESLPDAQRQAMVLYYYKQMPVADIAKIQDVPVDSVKSRLNYGRKKMAEAVEKYEKKTGTKLLVMTSVLLTMYFKMDMAANAQTVVEAADTGLTVAETVIEVAEKKDNATTTAKTAGKMLSKHLAKKTILKASAAVIATGAIGGTAYVYETQISVEATDEALFEWNGNEIIAYTGDETDIVIPSRATGVGEKAFYNNTNIHSVDFTSSEVKAISRMAFSGCNMLSQVILPDSIEQIGFEAFSGCSLLSEITIPPNVRTIDGGAFSGCTSLNSLCIDSVSLSKCGSNIFSGCSLSDVTLNNKMTYIPANLFNGADFVPETTVVIPKEVVSIGDRAFYSEGRKSPTYISFDGNKVTEIGYMAFYKSEIKNLTLPESLEIIGFAAFENCEYIDKIVISSNVHKIDGSAFAHCVGLSDVTINSVSINECGTNIFYDCSLTNVTFCDAMTYIPDSLFYNANFVGDVSIEIPENVVLIKDQAFFSDIGKSPVEFVFKGNKLDEIGRRAFYKCEIKSFALNQGVEKVGFNVFGGCDSLTEFVIESSDIKFANAVFEGCNNINFVVIPSSSVENYLINEGFENRIAYIE